MYRTNHREQATKLLNKYRCPREGPTFDVHCPKVDCAFQHFHALDLEQQTRWRRVLRGLGMLVTGAPPQWPSVLCHESVERDCVRATAFVGNQVDEVVRCSVGFHPTIQQLKELNQYLIKIISNMDVMLGVLRAQLPQRVPQFDPIRQAILPHNRTPPPPPPPARTPPPAPPSHPRSPPHTPPGSPPTVDPEAQRRTRKRPAPTPIMCTICEVEVDDSWAGLGLHCNHLFHSECLLLALAKQPRIVCPTCAQPLHRAISWPTDFPPPDVDSKKVFELDSTLGSMINTINRAKEDGFSENCYMKQMTLSTTVSLLRENYSHRLEVIDRGIRKIEGRQHLQH